MINRVVCSQTYKPVIITIGRHTNNIKQHSYEIIDNSQY